MSRQESLAGNLKNFDSKPFEQKSRNFPLINYKINENE
jgi:hypothetical protein